MSIVSELMRRAGPQVRIRDEPPRPSSSGGKPEQLILSLTAEHITHAFDIARQLVYAGVSVRTAKKILEDLNEGKTVFVEAPSVADFEAMRKRLRSLHVATRRVARRQAVLCGAASEPGRAFFGHALEITRGHTRHPCPHRSLATRRVSSLLPLGGTACGLLRSLEFLLCVYDALCGSRFFNAALLFIEFEIPAIKLKTVRIEHSDLID